MSQPSPEVRFYAVTSQGRQKLQATTLEAAREEVSKNAYFKWAGIKRLVRETREVFENA